MGFVCSVGMKVWNISGVILRKQLLFRFFIWACAVFSYLTNFGKHYLEFITSRIQNSNNNTECNVLQISGAMGASWGPAVSFAGAGVHCSCQQVSLCIILLIVAIYVEGNSPQNMATINYRNFGKTQVNFVLYKISDTYYSLNILRMLIFWLKNFFASCKVRFG